MLPSVAASALFVCLLVYVHLRRPPWPLWPVVGYMQVAGLLWCGGDLVSTYLVSDPGWHFGWLALEYVGVIGLTVSWWFLALRFSETQGFPVPGARSVWARSPLAMGVAFWVAMVTTPWHGQFLTAQAGSARSEFHWMFWLMVVWAYALNLGILGVYWWLRRRLKGEGPTTHVTLMMLAMGLTLAANVGYLLWPDPRFDPTSIALAVTTGMFVVAMYRSGIFGALPVALEEITRHDPDGVVLMDATGHVLYVNPAAQDLLGPRNLYPGANLFALLATRLTPESGTHEPLEPQALQQLMTAHSRRHQEHFYQLRDDDDRCLRLAATPLPAHNRGARVFSLRLRDVTQQMAAERAREHSERTYRAIFEGAQDAVFTFDTRGIGRSWNAAAARIFGWPAEEVVGHSLIERLLPPELRERAAEVLEEVHRLGSSDPIGRTIETELLDRDGSEIAIDLTLSLITVDGELRCLAFARDISQRRAAAAQLQHQRDLLRGVADATNLLLTTPDHAAAIRQAMEALGRACDVDRVYLVETHRHPETGAPLFSERYSWQHERVPALSTDGQVQAIPIDHPLLLSWYEQLQRGEVTHVRFADLPPELQRLGPFNMQSRLLVPIFLHHRPWGSIGFDDCRTAREWTEEEISILGAIAASLAGAMDREDARLALLESEVRYRRLVQDAPLGVIACDLTGKILTANENVVEMMGSPSVEATLAINLLEFPPLIEAGVADVVGRCMRSGERQHAEVSYVSAWGKALELRFHLAPTFDRAGAVTGCQAIVEDVTEYRHAEAALLHAQKLESLGVLAGGIAHDFNNLLVSVMGNAGLALGEVGAKAPVRRYLEGIETAAERASDLTRQLLAYAGKGRFVVEPIDLSEMVEEMTHLLDVSISKNVLVQFDLARDLPAVEADASQVRQIVMNLVINASDAIGDVDGVVGVRTGVRSAAEVAAGPIPLHGEPLGDGSYAYLQVQDTGCGMDAETQARMFDPFFTTKFAGRGLGLAGVLGIVRSHHGGITVESLPGEGTTFTVYLPASTVPVPTRAKPAQDSGGEPCSGTILVVDDDPNVVTVAQRILERGGFAVVTARDGVEALEVFAEHADEIAAVVLDMTMPRMSGHETLQHLRQRRRDLPVILTTGYSEQEAMDRFADQGLNGFLQKPYRSAALLGCVRAGLQPQSDSV